MGVLDASLVHPRETFRHAIHHGVSCIALAHNHPSGCVQPSDEDVAITKRLVEAGEIIGVNVLDHIVFSTSSDDYVSLREEPNGIRWPISVRELKPLAPMMQLRLF